MPSFTNFDDHQPCDDDFEDTASESSVESESNNQDTTANENTSDSDEEDEEDDHDEDNGEAAETSSRAKASSYDVEEDNFTEQQTPVSNPKELISKLMKRTRVLISMVHHSSILDAHVREQIYSKQHESNQRQGELADQRSHKGELVVDYRIRWNSSHLMLNRFIHVRYIINEITHTPDQIDGLKSEQERKLSRLAYNQLDWNWLIALEYVLQPFENGTRILSGRSYQTLAIKQLVMNGLKTFLTTYKAGEGIVNALKKLLLIKYQEHCEESISKQEREAMMVRTPTLE